MKHASLCSSIVHGGGKRRGVTFWHRLLPFLRIVDCPIVDEANGDRTAGDRAAHVFAEMQRRAALERRVHGVAIDVARLRRRIVTRIGYSRWGDHLSFPKIPSARFAR